MNEMLIYLNNGGPILVPILLCSIVALTITIERYVSLQEEKIVPHKLSSAVINFIEKGELRSAMNLIQSNKTPLGRICNVILTNREKERSVIVSRTEEVARHEAAKMDKYLEVLSVISSIAPMLGLMGTVLGMVVTFDSIQVHGLGNIDSLAGGISQALLTTLAGLLVGIPTLISHRYFLKVVDRHLLNLEAFAIQVIDSLKETL
jgi:biopolymer transport protein ExbB